MMDLNTGSPYMTARYYQNTGTMETCNVFARRELQNKNHNQQRKVDPPPNGAKERINSIDNVARSAGGAAWFSSVSAVSEGKNGASNV